MKLVKAAGFSSSPSWEGRKGPQTLSFQDIALLKAVLAAGLYDSVGKIMCTKSVDVTEKLACMVETAQGKAQVHPSSVNRDLQTYGWLLYQEKVKAPACPHPTSKAGWGSWEGKKEGAIWFPFGCQRLVVLTCLRVFFSQNV